MIAHGARASVVPLGISPSYLPRMPALPGVASDVAEARYSAEHDLIGSSRTLLTAQATTSMLPVLTPIARLFSLSEYPKYLEELLMAAHSELFYEAIFVLLHQCVSTIEKCISLRRQIERMGAAVRNGRHTLEKSLGLQAIQQGDDARSHNTQHLGQCHLRQTWIVPDRRQDGVLRRAQI
jgi:hypothetical protein